MDDSTVNSTVNSIVDYPARVLLANLPTRVHKLTALSRELGLDVFIKRDDETGSDLSGNKVRKLEFLLADARSQESDVILTCGGVQSNHCRATAVAARRLGMDSVLFLRGQPPRDADGREQLDGNLFLCAMVGAETRFVTPQQYEGRDELLAETARELRREGRRPYVVPEGGSNALGSFGYLRMVEELIESRDAEGYRAGGLSGSSEDVSGEGASLSLPWPHLVCATGSGGTLAGLLLGQRIFGLSTQVWGVNVAHDGPHFQARVASIASSFLETYGSKIGGQFEGNAVTPAEVHLLDGYVGPNYAETYEEEVRFIRQVARTDGVLLDPVYTGKALYGLAEEARAGRFDRGPVLFIHTGGIFSLFGGPSGVWADR